MLLMMKLVVGREKEMPYSSQPLLITIKPSLFYVIYTMNIPKWLVLEGQIGYNNIGEVHQRNKMQPS
jgi:hypothetical protein